MNAGPLEGAACPEIILMLVGKGGEPSNEFKLQKKKFLHADLGANVHVFTAQALMKMILLQKKLVQQLLRRCHL